MTHIKIIRDSFTGQSKGYGFATYSDPLYATTALRSLNGRKRFRVRLRARARSVLWKVVAPLAEDVNGRAIRLDDATSLAKRRKEKKQTEAYEKREAKRQQKKLEESGSGDVDSAASPASPEA